MNSACEGGTLRPEPRRTKSSSCGLPTDIKHMEEAHGRALEVTKRCHERTRQDWNQPWKGLKAMVKWIVDPTVGQLTQAKGTIFPSLVINPELLPDAILAQVQLFAQPGLFSNLTKTNILLGGALRLSRHPLPSHPSPHSNKTG